MLNCCHLLAKLILFSKVWGLPMCTKVRSCSTSPMYGIQGGCDSASADLNSGRRARCQKWKASKIKFSKKNCLKKNVKTIFVRQFFVKHKNRFVEKLVVKTLIRPKKSFKSQNAKNLDCQMKTSFFQIFFFKSQICLVPIFLSKIKFFKILFVKNFFVKNIICKIKFIKIFLSKVDFVKS